MSRLIIEGNHRLNGIVSINGAKNSALPVLAATLLARGTSEIHNCPLLSDVAASVRILRYLGCNVSRSGSCVTVDSLGLSRSDIPDTLMREMRSSIVFLGAIAARTGEAHMSFPGGCELGTRPIDLHLSALRQLGMEIIEERGRLECKVNERLKGTIIALSFPSVGATENILLASATAQGTTSILNAAREPEIIDLCKYLSRCGARISGAGESAITVEGVDTLYGCSHTVMPDRIETATYMSAAAITGGSLVLKSINPEHIATVLPAFEEAGCDIILGEGEISITSPKRLHRIRSIRTMPYPGFPTDAQAPTMAMVTVADGTSVFIENIFESRYKHAGELMRLGARIKTEGRVAVVEGVPRLSGAQVDCTDLRGGAALVVAALAADGITEVTQIHHIDRGYERLEQNLCALGAVIKRIE
ncbi:MAG: UDP-N-acetylglucosamine 1-carboxyvinyltransferase [Oscillospiraceae bacterium]|nr:UDP-N-acetylglucosamine 1-carboxyvinyltransferase [Oscillospiraceae bacterium]MDD4546250.1 UDP-N-acetylglucosamine 1-carboxyvinyltransferase [Oscillospiraceae bacterium]